MDVLCNLSNGIAGVLNGHLIVSCAMAVCTPASCPFSFPGWHWPDNSVLKQHMLEDKTLKKLANSISSKVLMHPQGKANAQAEEKAVLLQLEHGNLWHLHRDNNLIKVVIE